MRPIEMLYAIQHMALAEDQQLRPMHDPYNPGGELAQREMEATLRIKETTVNDSAEKDAIDPDASGGNQYQPGGRRHRKSGDEEKELETASGDDEPGPNLDILA